MPVPYTDLAKERWQQDPEVCLDAEEVYLNLGKKISTPQEVMVEELNLQSNKGSRMFQERLKRVERFTLENVAQNLSKTETHSEQNHQQGPQGSQRENFTTEVYGTQPGENSLISQQKHAVAKEGNPLVLAPGYSGPLKEVPHERFNVTVIPKSYYSPWQQQNSNEAEVLATICASLPEPPYKLTPANYKCFNRYAPVVFWAPMPFGGTAGSLRTLPLPGFELLQAYTEPGMTWDRMCARPNFNRAPQGWTAVYTTTESASP
ncbi:myozenin-2 [Chanos chanos]|uniref:Myozenin-2 n=1 Tax=Chanos chanos TaxID=29144 RepID=A0A6J2W0S9_CHACN|nr:myozenin-2-like [Chanos chanos]